MNRMYYEVEDDIHLTNRWYLDGLHDGRGIELDAREFTYGKRVDAGPPMRTYMWNDNRVIDVQFPLVISLDSKRHGAPLDFTYTNEDVPIVLSSIVDAVAPLVADSIQRIPVTVQSRYEAYDILNVVSLCDCIDRARSEIRWLQKGNEVRPDLAGEPESVSRLVVDPERTEDQHIFRIRGWASALVVSGSLKTILEERRVSGVRFRRVSP